MEEPATWLLVKEKPQKKMGRILAKESMDRNQPNAGRTFTATKEASGKLESSTGKHWTELQKAKEWRQNKWSIWLKKLTLCRAR
jgi:hypothetical protein